MSQSSLEFRRGCCLSHQLGKANQALTSHLHSMAATVSLSFSLDKQPKHHHFPHFKPHQTLPFTSLPLFPKDPLLTIAHKHNHYAFKSSSSSSHSTPSTIATTSPSFLKDAFQTSRFISNEEFEKLKLLKDFKYY